MKNFAYTFWYVFKTKSEMFLKKLKKTPLKIIPFTYHNLFTLSEIKI